MPELERGSDRWVSAVLSVLLHGTLIGALVYGWWFFRHPTHPEPTLAINATIVGPMALNGGGKRTQPPKVVAPPPPPPTSEDDQTVMPMPKPTVTPPQAASSSSSAAQSAVAEQEIERKAEQAREAKEEAERKAKAEEEAKARAAAAEQKRLAEAKRKAEEARRAQEAKELALNQTDINESISDEERLLEARSGPAMASWKQLIEARIHQAWIQPPTVRSGLDCTLTVTQVPGGQIVNVKLDACNGDAAVQQSIEDAAYRASPLPAPPDPSLFVRELTIHFTHTDSSP